MLSISNHYLNKYQIVMTIMPREATQMSVGRLCTKMSFMSILILAQSSQNLMSLTLRKTTCDTLQ